MFLVRLEIFARYFETRILGDFLQLQSLLYIVGKTTVKKQLYVNPFISLCLETNGPMYVTFYKTLKAFFFVLYKKIPKFVKVFVKSHMIFGIYVCATHKFSFLFFL